MADEIEKLPPLMGRQNRAYLAMCFGSTDGTVQGVADKYDRARLRARIRFQERGVAQWRCELLFDYGSDDGSLENVPPENREAAIAAVHQSHADVQAEAREVLERPMLLRDERDSLLQPFGDDTDD